MPLAIAPNKIIKNETKVACMALCNTKHYYVQVEGRRRTVREFIGYWEALAPRLGASSPRRTFSRVRPGGPCT